MPEGSLSFPSNNSQKESVIWAESLERGNGHPPDNGGFGRSGFCPPLPLTLERAEKLKLARVRQVLR